MLSLNNSSKREKRKQEEKKEKDQQRICSILDYSEKYCALAK